MKSLPAKATHTPSNIFEYLSTRESILSRLNTQKTSIEPEFETPILLGITLSNSPNPFNPCTTISFDLSVSDSRNIDSTTLYPVRIEIYNIKGQKVKTLVDNFYSLGSHSVVWDGTDDSNRSISSGIYFYRLKSIDTTLTRKMVLIK
jgi:hypothetical protein